MGPQSLLAAIDPKRMYRNRIDILKWISANEGSASELDESKYTRLDNGMIIKKETIRAGRLFVNGKLVEEQTMKTIITIENEKITVEVDDGRAVKVDREGQARVMNAAVNLGREIEKHHAISTNKDQGSSTPGINKTGKTYPCSRLSFVLEQEQLPRLDVTVGRILKMRLLLLAWFVVLLLGLCRLIPFAQH